MATLNEKRTETGLAVSDDMPSIERFGERFCSEAHAEEFAAGVRAARMQAAAQLAPAAAPSACSRVSLHLAMARHLITRGRACQVK
jgi:hypothetical protein